jgi:hypothetical protein
MKKTTPKDATAPKAPAKKPAPAKKKPAVQAEPPVTYIAAKIDIGFGNQLHLRGEGAGLSWDKGRPMDPVANDLWTAALKGVTGPVTFKVLVNDLSWSAGSDYVVDAGQSVTITPTF